MTTIRFGRREEANDYRDRLGDYVSASDDRRTKTIRLKPSTPDSIVDRLESTSFASVEEETSSAGMRKLSGDEKKYLKENTSFDWRENGFAAMRAKGALLEQGATDWLDFYEPGEGAGGSLQNLRSSKKSAARSGAKIGVKNDYTDAEEMEGRRRGRRQVEKAMSADVDRAKRPAFGGDEDAIGFLREEQIFNDDVFDISLRATDGPTGRDFEALQDAHADRSKRARQTDERRSAKVTRDPLKWAEAKGRYDFPGVDTIDVPAIHSRRSKRARETDEKNFAPLADSREQWVRNPDRWDWKGVDTPSSYGPTAATPIPEAEREMSRGLFGGGSESVRGLEAEDDFFQPMPRGPDDTGLGFRAVDAEDNRQADREMFGELFDASNLDGGPSDAELEEAYGDFADDSDSQGSLASFGMETDGSVYRESRADVESASTFGVDDRSSAARGSSARGRETSRQTFDDLGEDESDGWF